VQTTGGVGDHIVRIPCAGGLDRIEDDGGGIGTLFVLDDLRIGAARPDLQLVDAAARKVSPAASTTLFPCF